MHNFYRQAKFLLSCPSLKGCPIDIGYEVIFAQNMSEYFDNRQCIKAAILVMDCRHPFKPFDQMMLDWCVNSKVPIHILLTKSDKLKRGAASAAKLSALKVVKDLPSVSVQLFSSLKKVGVSELSHYLNQVFEMSDES